MKKTVTIEDVTYTVETMTAGDGLAIQESLLGDNQASNAVQMTLATVAKSIGKSVDEVKAMPWNHYQALIEPSLIVNGMKKADAATGEAQAGENLAA